MFQQKKGRWTEDTQRGSASSSFVCLRPGQVWILHCGRVHQHSLPSGFAPNTPGGTRGWGLCEQVWSVLWANRFIVKPHAWYLSLRLLLRRPWSPDAQSWLAGQTFSSRVRQSGIHSVMILNLLLLYYINEKKKNFNIISKPIHSVVCRTLLV